MSEKDPKQAQQSAAERRRVNIRVDDETSKGVYANRVLVAHTREEFIIDFILEAPPAPRVVARVVTAPAHARALLETLGDNLRRYEERYGPLPKNAGPPPAADA